MNLGLVALAIGCSGLIAAAVSTQVRSGRTCSTTGQTHESVLLCVADKTAALAPTPGQWVLIAIGSSGVAIAALLIVSAARRYVTLAEAATRLGLPISAIREALRTSADAPNRVEDHQMYVEERSIGRLGLPSRLLDD